MGRASPDRAGARPYRVRSRITSLSRATTRINSNGTRSRTIRRCRWRASLPSSWDVRARIAQERVPSACDRGSRLFRVQRESTRMRRAPARSGVAVERPRWNVPDAVLLRPLGGRNVLRDTRVEDGHVRSKVRLYRVNHTERANREQTTEKNAA